MSTLNIVGFPLTIRWIVIAPAVVSPFRSNEKLPRIPLGTLVLKTFDVTEASEFVALFGTWAQPRQRLAEALLDGLPRPVEGLCDLRPRSALRASLLDRSTLNLLQDLLHFRERVENHKRLVTRPNAEHRLSVATQDFLRNPLNHPGVIEIIGGGRVHALML